jgi:DNA-binding NtrC family response regulator
VKALTEDAMRACVAHRWKGNVRELRSALEQALLLATGAEISRNDLFGADGNHTEPALGVDIPDGTSFRDAKARLVESFERAFLVEALRRHAGNISKAAEEVGMYRQNFQQKMRELGITAEEAAGEPPGKGV